MKNMMMRFPDSRKSNGAPPTTTKSGKRGDDRRFIVRTRSPEETFAFGKKYGEALSSPIILLLEGTLGAGKTVFVQGLISGLGCHSHVTSPTFVLAQEYEGRLPIWHVDLYRLDRAALEDIGIEEYIGQSIVLIEWAERLMENIPTGKRITFTNISENEREIVVEV